jgi:hypothetical protein
MPFIAMLHLPQMIQVSSLVMPTSGSVIRWLSGTVLLKERT